MKTNVLIFVFLFLTACQNQTPAITPISTTASSTITQPPLVTSTPRRSPTLADEIQPTVQVEEELCQSAGYLGLTNDFYPNVYLSPSGYWIFAVCEKILNNAITYPFIILETGAKEPWIIDAKDIEPDLVEKYSVTTFQPVYWANDERKLYVIASLPCPDSFECWVYEDGESLYKLEMGSRKISVILPPYTTSPRFSYAFSISPDENYLAFVDQSTPSIIHIRDLASGNEKTVKLNGEFLRTGAFVWTPDSQEVAFSSLLKSNDDFFSSIFLYGISRRSPSILINQHLGVLFPNQTKLDENSVVKHWYDQDVLYVESIDQGYWYLNIRTKELTPEP